MLGQVESIPLNQNTTRSRLMQPRLPGTSGMSGRPPRVALYSHDAVGLGHVRRNLLISQTLRRSELRAQTLMLVGAGQSDVLPRAVAEESIVLPGLCKTPAGYASRSGAPLTDVIRLRSRAILAAAEAFEPDVLIVDKVPRGIRGELEPVLAWMRQRGGRCVLGLRDVLDDPKAIAREWSKARNEDAIRDYYDSVWVYGDPAIVDLAREHELSAATAAKLHYTGYLDRRVRGREAHDEALAAYNAHAPGHPYVLCMLGGGEDGTPIAQAFCHANLPRNLHGVLLCGPFMPAAGRIQLHRIASRNPRLHVIDSVREPAELMRRAERVVSMGGYNSFCEILAHEKPALIVPRVTPRLEQWIRAERFRAAGLMIESCRPHDLTPGVIEGWLCRSVEPVRSSLLDLGGLDRIPRLLETLIEESAQRPLAA